MGITEKCRSEGEQSGRIYRKKNESFYHQSLEEYLGLKETDQTPLLFISTILILLLL